MPLSIYFCLGIIVVFEGEISALALQDSLQSVIHILATKRFKNFVRLACFMISCSPPKFTSWQNQVRKASALSASHIRFSGLFLTRFAIKCIWDSENNELRQAAAYKSVHPTAILRKSHIQVSCSENKSKW